MPQTSDPESISRFWEYMTAGMLLRDIRLRSRSTTACPIGHHGYLREVHVAYH